MKAFLVVESCTLVRPERLQRLVEKTKIPRNIQNQ